MVAKCTFKNVSTFRQLESDDSNLTEVNINNMKRVSKERIRNLIKSAKHSKHITKLSLANTAISDSEARVRFFCEYGASHVTLH